MKGTEAGRRLRRAGLAIVALAMVGGVNLLVSGQVGAQEPPVPTDPALVAQGQRIFSQDCANCHGPQGQGLQSDTLEGGPSLIGVGAAAVDFMLRTGRMPALSQFEPLQARAPNYSDTERIALIAYVKSLTPAELAGPPIPDIDGWQEADLGLGLEVFTRNCAACHGPTAAGVAVGQTDVSSNLENSEPLVIAEAVRVGPGVMPVISPEILDDQELESVVRWVRYLADRDSPGGISLGRSGPVTEGLIAWVVGMGLLGVVIYLLGENIGTTVPDDENGNGSPTGTAGGHGDG